MLTHVFCETLDLSLVLFDGCDDFTNLCLGYFNELVQVESPPNHLRTATLRGSSVYGDIESLAGE